MGWGSVETVVISAAKGTVGCEVVAASGMEASTGGIGEAGGRIGVGSTDEKGVCGTGGVPTSRSSDDDDHEEGVGLAEAEGGSTEAEAVGAVVVEAGGTRSPVEGTDPRPVDGRASSRRRSTWRTRESKARLGRKGRTTWRRVSTCTEEEERVTEYPLCLFFLGR